jgi:hypothetical protein
MWRGLWPSYASRGCVFGYGAVIVNKEKMGEESLGLKKPTVSIPEYRVPRNPYPSECNGFDFATMRIPIGFPFSTNL